MSTTFNPFNTDAVIPPERPANEVQYDRWGRYANLPAVPGFGTGPWTRVTTLAKTLEDTFNLEQWRLRQAALGFAAQPELLNLVKGPRFNAASDHGKTVLNQIVTQAMEYAGSFTGADKGTEFHLLAEKIDAGQDVDPDSMEPDMAAMAKSYVELLGRSGVRPLADFMERVVVVPELGVAGRLDRIYSDNGVLRIGDLKTQKSLTFGHLSLATQFACYANASYILNHQTWTWEPMPRVDKDKAVIMWVPAVEPGRAEIHEVDISFGWTLAKAAARVREWRKRKDLVTRRPV